MVRIIAVAPIATLEEEVEAVAGNVSGRPLLPVEYIPH